MTYALAESHRYRVTCAADQRQYTGPQSRRTPFVRRCWSRGGTPTRRTHQYRLLYYLPYILQYSYNQDMSKGQVHNDSLIMLKPTLYSRPIVFALLSLSSKLKKKRALKDTARLFQFFEGSLSPPLSVSGPRRERRHDLNCCSKGENASGCEGCVCRGRGGCR